MVPVFQNVEERSTAKNYSPVSLLSAVSKVFEKPANNRIVDYLEKYGLFSDEKWSLEIRSMKFLSPEVVLYLYKSTIGPCMKYCCHAWARDLSGYLGLLDKLQKRICRTFGASLEPLAHRRNVASLSLLFGITLVDVYLNWPNWFHLIILEGGLFIILIDCMIFLSPFLDGTRMSTVYFLARLGSEFSAYRMLSFDLKSKWL